MHAQPNEGYMITALMQQSVNGDNIYCEDYVI